MRQALPDSERGADRRAIYTQTLIKSSFLELLQTHSFTSISVTALAERAGIGRNTFYRHFNNTFDVLEAAIEDALTEVFTVFAFIGIGEESSFRSFVAPFCEYVLGTKRYRLLFTDPDLRSIVISKIVARFPNAPEAHVRFYSAGMLEVCSSYANAPEEQKTRAIAALDTIA